MQNLAIKTPVQRHVPITVEMYHQLAEQGAFHPEDRVELIGGKIFDMSPIGSLHARCVRFLNSYLSGLLGDEYILSIQDPIVLDDRSEPQPDISVLKYRPDFYKDELPGASDAVLVIEVADSSAEFDRGVKFARYAAAGIREAWLVDLNGDRVEVHTQPKSNGYGLAKMYRRGENAVSETIAKINLPVDDILG